MRSPDDTIAAIATPLGEAGLGVIRVSGPIAISLVSRFFHSATGPALTETPARQARYGTLADGETVDHAIVTLFRAPHSYTGQDIVELSLHGSPFVLDRALALCLHHGARTAEPGEFTLRAFLAGKMDLTQAEAVAELIHSRTAATHRAALSQLGGHLAIRVRALRDSLLPFLAHIEVGLDHSDEDHDFLDRGALRDRCRRALADIDALKDYARIGKILREGLRVAIVGRPNVGKSSLLNALLRDERAIVTSVAGTTRDTLEESLDAGGIRIVLTDTAGLRKTDDIVERLGADRSRRAAESADLLLLVLDGSVPVTPEDRALIDEWKTRPILAVINKSDLTPAWRPSDLGIAQHCSVSAQTGSGLDQLLERVKSIALGTSSSTQEAAFLLNTRHKDALERARSALARAADSAENTRFEECVALDLREALAALGEIIGETTTDDLLDQIFSTFCIGK